MNSKFSRRLILKGLGGAAIALPLLDVNQAFAQSAPMAKRFVVFFEHGGTISASQRGGTKYSGNGAQSGTDAWRPASNGEALQLGPIHQPLVPYTDSLLVLRSIDNMAGREQGPYGGDHGWANVTAMTAAKATQLNADTITSEGPSLDFVLASRLAMRNPVKFASLNLALPAHNYGTPFFKAARQPVDGEWNPTAAFNSLFAGVSTGTSGPDPAAVRARALKKSVLDGTGEQLTSYKGKLSTQDTQTIDAHLEHIRSIEKRISTLPVPQTAACSKPTVPSFSSYNWYSVPIDQSGPLMVDLMIAAFRCGLTNVSTLNIGDFYAKWLNPSFPAGYDIGHSLHHSANDVGKLGTGYAQYAQWYDTILKNRQWRIGLLARFCAGMKATPEGNGTMLDNSLALWNSEFSAGNDHSVSDLPILLAGKAGGYFKTGRHLDYNVKAVGAPTTSQYQSTASTHNLFTSILNAFGYADSHSGTTGHAYVTGALPRLTA